MPRGRVLLLLAVCALVPPCRALLSRVALHFDFEGQDYAAGVRRIHTPERLLPLCRMTGADAPRVNGTRASVVFGCATPLIAGGAPLRARLISSAPHESRCVIFDARPRALYGVRLRVLPTDAFRSHRLRVDVALFGAGARDGLRWLLPLTLFLLGDDAPAAGALNANLTAYRRAVLSGDAYGIFSRADDADAIAWRDVRRAYSGDETLI